MSTTIATGNRPADPEPRCSEELHFHRLLVPVDGSPSSDLAVAAAVTAARRDHAILILLAVARDVAADAARTGGVLWAAPASQEEADAWAERTVRDAVARVPEDVSVRTVVRRGGAAREILRELGERDYDAVIMGARGLGRVAMLMGSVSREVLHHAEVPVFVAHAPRVEARTAA